MTTHDERVRFAVNASGEVIGIVQANYCPDCRGDGVLETGVGHEIETCLFCDGVGIVYGVE